MNRFDFGIPKKLKKFYVCSPIYADTKEETKANIQKSKEYMKTVSERFECRALAPHAYLSEMYDNTDPVENTLGYDACISYLEKCAALVVCGSRITNTMVMEIEIASVKGIPIYIMQENYGNISITINMGFEVNEN